ncbi:hypothetical protein BACCIP111895_01039 [Neobacillus rhizosphaerae]|uniref:Uncharacterized protein n=1 Tax=Neobacillus rhizosphaerae TaxID=2880965 RepID=A0ABM9EMN9_9BACI|nr:hypothetical protein BACCIP111895_01039 [Neobacillus rhizosphaerae]
MLLGTGFWYKPMSLFEGLIIEMEEYLKKVQ